MPDITVVEDCEVNINIDVYCTTCGAGLCGVTSVDERRRAFHVEACPHCMAEKDDEIARLHQEINDLNNEIIQYERGY